MINFPFSKVYYYTWDAVIYEPQNKFMSYGEKLSSNNHLQYALIGLSRYFKIYIYIFKHNVVILYFHVINKNDC